MNDKTGLCQRTRNKGAETLELRSVRTHNDMFDDLVSSSDTIKYRTSMLGGKATKLSTNNIMKRIMRT